MQDDPGDERLTGHLTTILSVSGGMVGVCLSAIGILGVIKTMKRVDTICDDLLAVDAFLFLTSAILSFLVVRTPLWQRRRRVAVAIDGIFCTALVGMVAVCGLLVWVVF
jgi:hypothetical protein